MAAIFVPGPETSREAGEKVAQVLTERDAVLLASVEHKSFSDVLGTSPQERVVSVAITHGAGLIAVRRSLEVRQLLSFAPSPPDALEAAASLRSSNSEAETAFVFMEDDPSGLPPQEIVDALGAQDAFVHFVPGDNGLLIRDPGAVFTAYENTTSVTG